VGGLARGAVRGYPARETVVPGQMQRIYVNAPGARWLRIAVFRMGWYRGSGGREVLLSRRLPARRQPPCTHVHATGLTECRWHPALSFRIPHALASGVYIAKLTAPTGASDVLFVVTATRPAPLLAQLPTATYEAYNAWGGDSLYPGGADRVGVTGTTQGVAVSFQRPYDSVTGAGQFFARDVAMVRFLERHRLPVSYTTSEGADRWPQRLRGHRALLDFGHSEYWSRRAARAFKAAARRGTSLLFLSSDTMAWRIRFTRASRHASSAGEPGQTIVAYKQYAVRDSGHRDRTGAFGSAAAALTGSRYTGCITPRLRRPGPPAYRLYAWHPSPWLRPRWLFAHTGLTASASLPGIVGYEVDGVGLGTPAAARLVGAGGVSCMGVEAGEVIPTAAAGEAATTLYRTRSGATVFASGTLGWELGLEPVRSASPDAPRAPERALVTLTLNLLRHVLRPR
jgi:hypothetical protein